MQDTSADFGASGNVDNEPLCRLALCAMRTVERSTKSEPTSDARELHYEFEERHVVQLLCGRCVTCQCRCTRTACTHSTDVE
jgi:hypothetical protein